MIKQINDLDSIKSRIDEMNQSCEELWKSHNYADSLTIANKAFQLSDEINYEKGKADSYRTIGTIYSIQSKNLEARDYLEKAIIYYTIANDEIGEIRCHTNLGIIDGNTGQYQHALDHFYKAMQICENLNLNKFLAEQYLNIGSVFRKLRNLDKAYDYYKKSLKIKVSLNDEIGIGAVFNNLGNIYRAKHDNGLSLGYFKKALKIWEKHDYKRGMATVINNISTILIERKNYNEAISYIEKQLAISVALDLNNPIALAFVNLSAIYVNKQNFIVAEDYLNNAAQIIDSINDKELVLYYTQIKIDFYNAKKDYFNAFVTSKTLISVKDSLFDERLSEKITEIESSYQIKQKEQENELYRLKNVELVNAFKEIELQKEKLSDYNHKLEDIDKSREAIMRIVSHDLKNLIGSISSVVELLKYEDLAEKTDSYLKIIEQSTDKAMQLLHDLLDSNSIDMQNFSLDLEKNNLILILENFKHAFITASKKKAIAFTLDYTEDDISLLLDTDRFWQLISNLVFNAIKFTDKNGKVTIKIYTIQNKCIIEVIDTGIGIRPEMLPFIFDKFTKAKRKGTDGEITYGLGLSIVKRLTELHNGSISVSSEIEKGTTFRLEFPLAD